MRLLPLALIRKLLNQEVWCFYPGKFLWFPRTMEIVKGDFKARVRRVFENIKAIVEEAGGDLSQIVKLTIYFTNMNNFSMVNEVMQEYFTEPYPARAVLRWPPCLKTWISKLIRL